MSNSYLIRSLYNTPNADGKYTDGDYNEFMLIKVSEVDKGHSSCIHVECAYYTASNAIDGVCQADEYAFIDYDLDNEIDSDTAVLLFEHIDESYGFFHCHMIGRSGGHMNYESIELLGQVSDDFFVGDSGHLPANWVEAFD